MEPNSEAPQLGWGSARGTPFVLRLATTPALDNIAYLVVIPS